MPFSLSVLYLRRIVVQLLQNNTNLWNAANTGWSDTRSGGQDKGDLSEWPKVARIHSTDLKHCFKGYRRIRPRFRMSIKHAGDYNTTRARISPLHITQISITTSVSKLSHGHFHIAIALAIAYFLVLLQPYTF